MSKNVLVGIAILLASGFATWLFLPMVSEPLAETPPPPEPVIVQIGPIQVNMMLFVLFFAAGVPFMGLVMAVVLRWLGKFVPAGASTPAPSRAARASSPAPAGEVTATQDLSLAQQAALWLVIVLAFGVILFFLWQVLPPGFTLF
ncbi:MAG TPA: hypothetical protein VJ793_15725 [Anaerolineae bacterium]|nr:hypothetical protein [Anaerolineae bacterium]